MIFPDTDKPRIFATPLGVDFSAALIEGLDMRLEGMAPEAIARVEIWVNTRRMQRHLHARYASRNASFLPRIRALSDLSEIPDIAGLPKAMSPLRLRLELSQFIGRLLDQDPQLAPRSAIYDLADSLAEILAEMQEERVNPEDLRGLNVEGHSQHWDRALQFLNIVSAYFEPEDGRMTPEARQTALIDRLVQHWSDKPPKHPLIVAGSTGSRGATRRLMEAVAHLPQGAVILPGLDYDMPEEVWQRLLRDRRPPGLAGEDHPQYRLGQYLATMGLRANDVQGWPSSLSPVAGRNKLLSLALRPAPMTDQWLSEGPTLPDPDEAMEKVTLIEAATPQEEAAAIALRLRRAVEDGQRAALVSTDRVLGRQVTAALDRWGITPDDSAGVGLSQTPPGRFLRHIAELGLGPVTGEDLLVLLKHPLTNTGGEDRGDHLRRTRDLELDCLRGGPAFPRRADLVTWAQTRKSDEGAIQWAIWVGELLLDLPRASGPRPLADHLSDHIALAEALSAGPDVEQGNSGALWLEGAGIEARRLITDLTHEADAAGSMSLRDYRDLFSAILETGEVRNPVRPHADVMIWGAMEARVQGADLVILAGLNEGTWPANPGADPWLNRALRAEAGLRLPDRRIGLSAHDFQQAAAAPEVWLSRSKRDTETETVPSRWLNRMINLMEGASPATESALAQMRERGEDWLKLARMQDMPLQDIPRATRPSPCPPVAVRPRVLSVTEVEKLVRDPYAVYARRVLELFPLKDLKSNPDAAERGTALHAILFRFIDSTKTEWPADPKAYLMKLAEAVLDDVAPWPAARRLWLGRLQRVADWFLATEEARRKLGRAILLEHSAQMDIPRLGVTLKGTADRVDRRDDGSLAIYDYKAGKPPTKEQQQYFNKQLWLEAWMARDGAFTNTPEEVAEIAYIGLNSREISAPDIEAGTLSAIEAEFHELLGSYQQADKGFTSRRAMFKVAWDGDYDQLARYGEWDATTPPTQEDVG